jgi:uncharacterized RDD family membrane protein YckC
VAPLPEAPLARRLASLGYDALLVCGLLFFGALILLVASHATGLTVVRPLLQGYLLVLAGGYLVYCWTHGGQTLAMKTWRIQLQSRDGGKVTLAMATQRYLWALVAWSLFALTLLWVFFDRDRRYLHDRLAGTRLVRVRSDDAVPPN